MEVYIRRVSWSRGCKRQAFAIHLYLQCEASLVIMARSLRVVVVGMCMRDMRCVVPHHTASHMWNYVRAQ